MRTLLPALVLLPFTVFSIEVVAQHGYLGFVTLALREPWGMQIVLDLCIALFLVGAWVRKDARARGIVSWPYLVAMVLLGSIGALAYLVHRGLAGAKAPTSAPGRLSAVE